MKSWLTPIRILLIYLGILAVGASLSWKGLEVWFWVGQFRNAALLWGSGWLLYQILLRLKLIRPTRWEHRAITGLILFLLFDPGQPWWLFAVLGVVAEVGQRWLRVPTGPLMNPAALAAVIITFFGFYPAWWGASFAPRIPITEGGISIAMLLTVTIAGYVAYTYRKLPIVPVFLVIFSVAYWLVFQVSPVFLLLEGTIAFFLLVMAVEPKTSPVLLKEQLLYGGALAFLVVAAQGTYFAEPYAGALLVCNVVFNLYRNRQLLLKRFKSSPTAGQPPAPAAQ